MTKPIKELEVIDFNGIDVLIHLASHSVQYPFDTLENNIRYNVIEPLEMFEKAVKAGVHKFLVTGSCFEYGLSGEKFDFIPTYAPLEPTNDYATSKAMSFLGFKQFALNNKVKLSYQRIFHAFGEGQPENRLWPSIRKAALAGDDLKLTLGEQIRDFVPVEEVSSQLILSCNSIELLTSNKVKIQNIGSGEPKSISEFAKYWWDFWEAKGKLKFGSIPYRENEIMRFVPMLDN